MGCWKMGHGANATSHVAVTEPMYRFPMDYNGKLPSDYTSAGELLEQGERWVKYNGIDEHIKFHTEVTDITKVSDKRVRVTYRCNGVATTVEAAGVYIAIGAQAIPRTLGWKGEEVFK